MTGASKLLTVFFLRPTLWNRLHINYGFPNSPLVWSEWTSKKEMVKYIGSKSIKKTPFMLSYDIYIVILCDAILNFTYHKDNYFKNLTKTHLNRKRRFHDLVVKAPLML